MQKKSKGIIHQMHYGQKKSGVLFNDEPKYTFSFTLKNKLDFTELFKIFGNGLYEFSLPYVHHTVIIMKSKSRYKFFEANAGAISCKSSGSFHTILNGYFSHETIWTKYSKTVSLPVDVGGEVIKTTTSIKFDLLKVFTKIPKKK